MASVVEITDDGGGIVVRDATKLNVVPTPQGFNDITFRNAVAAANTLYLRNGKVPTVNEMHALWPRIPVKTFAALALTEEFRQALDYRGIQWNETTGLSYEQNMALLKLSDPTDRRMTGAKLKELGVPYARYQAWMRDAMFSQALRSMSENNLKDAIPVALNKLVANAESGDQRAIEKVLEVTGRYNPAAQQVEDAKVVVRRIIEAVIRHVQDPDIRRAIMSDIESEAVAYSVTTPQALES